MFLLSIFRNFAHRTYAHRGSAPCEVMIKIRLCSIYKKVYVLIFLMVTFASREIREGG